MTTAVYAFSGDPITFGHIDIVERVSKAFDKIVVAIGKNPKKNYTFRLEERFDMAKRSLAHIPNVEVECFHGLLVDFAYTNGISVIVRGIRNVRDMIDENELFYINISQNRNIDTFFLPSDMSKLHISSSAAKGLQEEQGFLHEYVPLCVKQKLEERISLQRIVGITGGIGCGKSYVANKFEDFIRGRGYNAQNIELDEIGHEILKDNNTSLGKKIFNQILVEIGGLGGADILKLDGLGEIDRKKLGEIVFNDYDKLKKLNEIMREPILTELRQHIYKKKGLMFINAALIAEAGLGYLCNNNIIIVESDFQEEALKNRELTEEQIKRRIGCQLPNERKKEIIEKEIQRTNNGKVWIFKNEKNNEDEEHAFEQLYYQILEEIK